MSERRAKSEEPSDASLLESVRAGNRQVFSLIIERWQGDLLRFLRLLGADAHLAEDIVQETFLKLYASCRRGDRPWKGSIRPLLFRIARTTRIDQLRKARRSPPVVPLEAAVDVAAGSGSEPERRGAALDVLEALASLPEKHRVVLILNVLHGLSYREVAAVLEIPVGTVKSRMHYALCSLKETLHVRAVR